jgi:hypothetical protein
VLFTAGSQLPVNPFVDVVGRIMDPPKHIGVIGLNVGATGAPTLTVIVVVVAH